MTLPTVIDSQGEYITRSGEVVEVTDVSGHHWKHGRHQNGISETWHRSGRIFSGRETENDIIRKKP